MFFVQISSTLGPPVPDADEESLLSYGEDGLQAPGSTKRMERRCPGVAERLEGIPGVRERASERSPCPSERVSHTSPSPWTNTEANNVCTSWTPEKPGFLDESMNDYETVCGSVHDVDEPTNNNNTDPLELFRTEENFGEEYQSKGELELAVRSNKLTSKQANTNDTVN